MATDPFKVLSLCSGGGGLDLGVDLAVENARVVCCVEHEAYCGEVLDARMEEKALASAGVWSDLRTFDGHPFRGRVDCITAGYPCQPFSVAGRRLGSDDPRHLWPHVARIIGEVEPGYVFLENVAGHIILGFNEVLGALAEGGYDTQWLSLSAADVGASHRRQRLFCLAYARALRCDTRRPTESLQRPWQDGRAQHMAHAQSIRTRPGRMPCGAPTTVAEPAHSGSGLPSFPPGPGDAAGWAAVFAARPDLAPTLEPSVCGVADGMALRVERLRMLGNGVVPIQAAVAFLYLFAIHQQQLIPGGIT